VAPIAFMVVLVATVAARSFLRYWILARYRAGTMSGRKAGWLYGATIAAPFLALAVFTAINDVGNLWIILVLMALTLPVIVVPYVAIFRYPTDDPRSKRFGGPVP
jgi:hypothetical protein